MCREYVLVGGGERHVRCVSKNGWGLGRCHTCVRSLGRTIGASESTPDLFPIQGAWNIKGEGCKIELNGPIQNDCSVN